MRDRPGEQRATAGRARPRQRAERGVEQHRGGDVAAVAPHDPAGRAAVEQGGQAEPQRQQRERGDAPDPLHVQQDAAPAATSPGPRRPARTLLVDNVSTNV
jgi:hypothetical protein